MPYHDKTLLGSYEFLQNWIKQNILGSFCLAGIHLCRKGHQGQNHTTVDGVDW